MVGFRLTPCPSCHEHVLAEERECPHCGAVLRTTTAPLAAVIAGLVLTAGCPIDAEPIYGVPATTGDPEPTSGTEADTDGTMTGSTGGASGDATAEGTGSTTSEPEPEYGVPTTSVGSADTTDGTTGTTSGPEPDYGVPTTSG